MSFSGNEQGEKDLVPNIIYNLSYIEESSLSKKEKSIIKKICRNARKNNKVEISNDINGISVFIPEIVVPQMEEIVYKIYHMYYEDNVLNDTIYSDLLAKMYAIFRKIQSTIYKGYQILGSPY